MYLCCVSESFQLKNAIGLLSWVITAPSCLLEAVCVNLKDFWIVRIGQNYILSGCSFYVIKCSLIDLIPMPGYLLGPFCFCGFGLTALPNQWGVRGKHFAPSFPEVTVILHHAWEMLELSYSCGRFIASITCTLLPRGLMPSLWVCTPGILFQVRRMSIFGVDFQSCIAKPPEYLF